MNTGFARSAKTVLFLAFCLCPFVVHFALTTGRGANAAAMMSGVDIAVMGTLFTLKSADKWKWWAAGITVACLSMLALWWHASQQNFLATSGIPHAAVYFGLLIFFGRTLLPGREALISSVAAKVYGRPLSDGIATYTRGVTAAWCVFFALQIAVSLLLFLFAPLPVWSLFVNILNFPLLVLMFGCEYLYRRWRVPERPPSNLSDVVRAFMQSAASGMSRPDPDYRSP
jgi:uncharacterized membrane protein